MIRRFYDIHYHLFDLSHPNLLAFILRDDMITGQSVRNVMRKLPFLMNFVPTGAVRFFPGRIASKIKDYITNDAVKFRNLLSIMENAVEFHFLLADYYLQKEKITEANPSFPFDRIVLCPLLIDFGYKNLKNSGCYYDLPPTKPVAGQVADVFNAIWFYYNYEITGHPVKEGQLKLIRSKKSSEERLFEIYPFLGINTRNYDLLEIKALIDKYFPGYENDSSGEERHRKLFSRLGAVRLSLEDLIFRHKEKEDTDHYAYLFAGIKLYPPLGFDPWPENEPAELDKVKFLYSECARKRIPVTVHCSDGGFRALPGAEKFSDPRKWVKVFNNSSFKSLKVNFAHMGNQASGKNEWLKTILMLMEKYENVYTDFSCLTPEKEDYKKIQVISEGPAVSRILFGSDFIINLLWSDSYNKYLANFLGTNYLSDGEKLAFATVNPEKFLFE